MINLTQAFACRHVRCKKCDAQMKELTIGVDCVRVCHACGTLHEYEWDIVRGDTEDMMICRVRVKVNLVGEDGT